MGVGASGWHIDGTSYEKPFQIALLNIVHPLESSGPTLFLPLSPLASRIREHNPSWGGLWVQNGKGTHPLLYRSPRGQTGVCLGKAQSFVSNLGAADERAMDEEETAATCAALNGHVEALTGDNGHVYRHEWRAGDLVLLDNLAVAHLASPASQRTREEAGLRVLHRIVVAGDATLTPLDASAPGSMCDLFSKEAPADAERVAARALVEWPEWTSEPRTFQESKWWLASGRERAAEERCLVTAGRATLWPQGGGPPVEIAAGDWATFRRGFLCDWVVHDPIAKRYAYFDEVGEEL